jgi:putative peptide zinc metalloprotease protein
LIPQLKPDIRFSSFDEASSSRGRRLVEVGEACFAVSEEMYYLLELLAAGPSSIDQLTEDLNARIGTELTVDAVSQLLASHIPPALRADQPDAARKTPFLASVRLFSANAVRPLTSRLTILYSKPVVIVALIAFAIVTGLSMKQASAVIHNGFSIKELVVLYCGVALIGLIHELGHATASHRHGCEHGDIGFGLYYILPAFYADVTKAWRLAPRQRAVIDAGGLYFNAITIVPLGIFGLATGNQVALRLVWITLFVMLQNLNPMLKFDGYWLFSDLAGLTNLHTRVAETFTRAFRRLLGRRNPADEHIAGVRRGLLYLYVAAVAVYAVFIIEFLVRSIRQTVATYPERAAKAGAAIASSLHLAAWSNVALEAWRILAMSVWPLILTLALLSIAFRIGRGVRRFAGAL